MSQVFTCPNCHHELTIGETVCPGCGASLDWGDAGESNEEQLRESTSQPIVPPSRQMAAKSRRGVKWSMLLVCSLVVLAAGGMGIWGLRVLKGRSVGAESNSPSLGERVPSAGNERPAGDEKVVALPGGVEMTMIWCPPGSFLMGSPKDETGRGKNETQHRVTLTEGFWLAKYELTQAQWQSVMGANAKKGWVDGNLPASGLGWEDCAVFCEQTGLRFPTEAEWEYACRAGREDPFSGSGKLDEMGWFKENSEDEFHPVGQKMANDWGFHDMHGNVTEWCADSAEEEQPPDYPDKEVTNPKGEHGGERIYRGGYIGCDAESCRSAARAAWVPDSEFVFKDFGFRPAMSEKEEGEPEGGDDAPLSSVGVLSAGDEQTVTLPGGATMQMVWCPPGKFMMGSIASEEGHESSEKRHEVTLTHGFWMAKTEVTQHQWKSVMGNNPSEQRGQDLPLENAQYSECKEFCAKLGMRLPTEAEWEYACRAGSAMPFGDNHDLDDMGWYMDNSGGRPHRVGQKHSNAWGLLDMHGNVAEWCADYYEPYSGDSETNPTGPTNSKTYLRSGQARVKRGGQYDSPSQDCRSAARKLSLDSFCSPSLGFRPVMDEEAMANAGKAEEGVKRHESFSEGLAGLFGMEFGHVMPPWEAYKTNNVGERCYEWKPQNRFRHFENYVLFTTPKSLQVEQIRAVCSSYPDSATREVQLTVRELEGLTGKKADWTGKPTIRFDNGDYIVVSKQEGAFEPRIFIDAVCARLQKELKRELRENDEEDADEEQIVMMLRNAAAEIMGVQEESNSSVIESLGLQPSPPKDGSPLDELNAVFGIEFGVKFPPRGYINREKSSEGVWVYTFMPHPTFLDFSVYLAFATPQTEKVCMFRAAYNADDEDDCQKKYEEAVQVLESATGHEFDEEERDGASRSRTMEIGGILVEIKKDGEDDVVVLDFTHELLFMKAALEAGAI